ncbi:hypothetical protein, partial [Bacteroides heparinolyticus]|uniref:hypothetical protein n=1 Tax=Prevotella heparinolytica TaxID=28113 RepID=UPI0035A050D1
YGGEGKPGGFRFLIASFTGDGCAKLRIKTTYGRRFYSKHYIIRIIICIFVARINGRSFGKV